MMNYHFIDRYCELTIQPETGVVLQLHGWITYANAEMLLLTDEEGDEIPIDRKDLCGSIVVVEEQREIRNYSRIILLKNRDINP